jgi:WD40 repeat protein
MELRCMRNDPLSTSWSSDYRSDGVPESVSVGRTTSSPIAWRYVLAAVLFLAVVIVINKPWENHASSPPGRSLAGHAQFVESVTFSPDGQSLASCSWDYTVRIWDLSRWDDEHPAEPVVLRHETTRFMTAFSPDGSTLVSAGDRSLTIWSHRPEYHREVHRSGESYHCLAFSPDGRTLALGAEDSTVRLWDMPSARERGVLRDHTGTIRSVAFSPDGRLLVSSSQQGRVVIWDLASGSEVRTLVREGTDPIASVAFSPDGRTIGVADFVFRTRDVCLFDVETGAVRSRLTGHRRGAHGLAFSSDGRYLATAGVDRCIKLWDLATSKEVASLTEGVGWVKAIAFSPDGSRIAYCGKDELVRIWDLRSQGLLATGGDSVREGPETRESRVKSESTVAGSSGPGPYSSGGRRS